MKGDKMATLMTIMRIKVRTRMMTMMLTFSG